MRKQEVAFLNQLVQSLDEASIKLDEASKRGDAVSFNKIKKFIEELQKRMQEVLK